MGDEYITGLTGRVTVPISADLPGEVILWVRGGSEAYTAYTTGGEEVKKNSHVVVIEQTGPRTVMVTATGA